MYFLNQEFVIKGLRVNQHHLAALLFIIGFALLAAYSVGMNGNPLLHEAFHDVRHAAGFPCH